MAQKTQYNDISENYYALLHAGFSNAECHAFIINNTKVKWCDHPEKEINDDNAQ